MKNKRSIICMFFATAMSMNFGCTLDTPDCPENTTKINGKCININLFYTDATGNFVPKDDDHCGDGGNTKCNAKQKCDLSNSDNAGICINKTAEERCNPCSLGENVIIDNEPYVCVDSVCYQLSGFSIQNEECYFQGNSVVQACLEDGKIKNTEVCQITCDQCASYINSCKRYANECKTCEKTDKCWEECSNWNASCEEYRQKNKDVCKRYDTNSCNKGFYLASKFGFIEGYENYKDDVYIGVLKQATNDSIKELLKDRLDEYNNKLCGYNIYCENPNIYLQIYKTTLLPGMPDVIVNKLYLGTDAFPETPYSFYVYKNGELTQVEECYVPDELSCLCTGAKIEGDNFGCYMITMADGNRAVNSFLADDSVYDTITIPETPIYTHCGEEQ